jgi:cytochrome c oxidase assembly protein subunit 15
LEQKKRKAVAIWLLAGVAMIVIEFIMGGVTRLTGSGLSITEWKPIMGIIPPLNETEWNKAFDGYKNIAQYKYLNSHFTLSDFKFIFFWEWSHRVWARLLGVVFGIGFIYFLIKKYFDKEMIRPFMILFLLGGLQGFIGWKMVQSGLNDTSLYVKHTLLATHFLSAMALTCYTLWLALQLLIPEGKRLTDSKLYAITLSGIALLFVQLAYGAFMAGLHAAKNAPTWPTINGMWLPGTLQNQSLINNEINVQFIHRGLAYLLLIFIITWFYRASQTAVRNQASILKTTRWWPLVLVVLQVALGISTVLCAPMITFGRFGVFETLAEAHQLVAMFLLMSLVLNLYVVKRKEAI